MKKFSVLALLSMVIAFIAYQNKETLPASAEHLPNTEKTAINTEAEDNPKKEDSSLKESTTTPVASALSSNDDLLDEDIPTYLNEFDAISNQHKISLHQTTQRIFRYAKRGVDSKNLVREFEKEELAPELRVDANPYTGTLNVVRTRRVMPGTRYFHAQFFEDEDGSEYVQHISFEFQGSEQSFEAVEKTILQQFAAGSVELSQNNENFRSWRRDDGYIIWMKKLEESDIKDNPFNVYTRDDVGTIRVAIELDIHDHSPAFHAEQGPLEEE